MAKYSARGAKLQQETETPGTFAEIANIKDLVPNFPERQYEDVTTHDSAGGFPEYIDGMFSNGDLPFEIIYDPADTTHERLRASYASGATAKFKLILPDVGAATFAFDGKVQKFSPSAPVNGPLVASCSIRMTGAVVFTA